LRCQKIKNRWLVNESDLDDFLTVKVIGKDETAGKKAKETVTSKDIDFPPYFVMVRRVGYLEGKVEMLEKENTLLKEQLTYQKTNWIKRLFKR